jgi:hypothetical protein
MAVSTHGVGLLSIGDPPDLLPLGTCFALRRPEYILTAAHCVKGLEHSPGEVHIDGIFSYPRRLPSPSRIVLHPQADLAVLQLEPFTWDDWIPFNGVTTGDLGDPVSAIGIPEDLPLSGSTGRVLRILSGHIQRLGFQYTSSDYRPPNGSVSQYDAGELTFAAPFGLSGGPVFPYPDANDVVGLVTENKAWLTYKGLKSDPPDPTQSVQFGVYVALPAYHDWLMTHAPPR